MRAFDQVTRADVDGLDANPRRLLIVIIVTVLDEICVRKRFFHLNEVVVRLMFAHEAGGNVCATRPVVDELVRIFADGTADRSQRRGRDADLYPVSEKGMHRA